MSELDPLEFLATPKVERKRLRLGWGNLTLLIGIIAVAAVFAVQLARQNATQPTSGPAPDFRLLTFEGGEIGLSDLRGQVVLVNFWASWCPPCRDEAPDLQALHEDYRDDGLIVIGVNILESSRQKARDFIAEFGISYPNGEDTGQFIAKLYRVEGPPETFLIDKRGNVRLFVMGGLQYEDMSASIESLLAEQA